MINEYLSYSRSKHLYCPLRYYINYIENYSYCSPALLIGSLIHRYYEEYIFFPEKFEWFKNKNYAINKIKNDCKVLLNEQQVARKQKIISETKFDEYRLNEIADKVYNLFNPDLINKIQNIYKNYLHNGYNIKIESEKEYNVDIEEDTYGRFKYFKIIPDIAIIVRDKNNEDNNEMIVIDIKTGGKYKSYNDQLNIYSQMLKRIKNIDNIINYIYYVKTNDLSLIPTESNFIDKFIDELNSFLNYFNLNSEDDYKNLLEDFFNDRSIIDELDKFKPKSERCNFCFISNWCPHHTYRKYTFSEIIEYIDSLQKNIILE